VVGCIAARVPRDFQYLLASTRPFRAFWFFPVQYRAPRMSSLGEGDIAPAKKIQRSKTRLPVQASRDRVGRVWHVPWNFTVTWMPTW